MKDYRSLVLRTIPNEKMRHTLDEIMRQFQQDSNLWLDAGLRLGHLDYMINALQDSKNDMDSDREEFKNMLVEFLKYAQEAAKNISSSTISSSIHEQIKEYVGAPMQEVCATTLAEYRTARDAETVWTARILRHTNTTLIICAIMCLVCLVGGYKWGAAIAINEIRNENATSQNAAKSSPFIAPFEEKPRQMPAQVGTVLATGKTIADALIIRKSPKKNTIVETGKDISIFEFSTAESTCPENTAYRIGPEDWSWICANKVHVLKQHKPIPYFKQ